MENVNGALGFRATLDIDDFNVSAEAMERRIKNVAISTAHEADRMDQSILNFAQNGAKYLVTYLVGNGLSNVATSIMQVRGQFQQLEIAFETMLGGASKSKVLMDQLIDTAARTPFDLTGVANGAKQLLAYGTSADKVNDTLVRLGNIASGLSIPLNDIVYLYGTTQVQGRLYAQDVRQFTGRGIPLVRELAEMYGKTAEEINAMVSAGKIGFDDVEKVMLKMTNSGGQFFNLMQKQSASLTGMIANLGDAWDVALNKLGEDNQNVFATGIGGATYLVEHLDDILRIIKSISIAYGTYKAAIVMNTIATKGYTGVALIDNTVRQTKIALMKVEENLSGKKTAQTAAMAIAEKAHTAALEAQLTTEEKSNVVKAIRISTIQNLLTVQQQEYLSNLGLTASSKGYESAALGILSVEQRESLSKIDLTSKSAIYRAAIEREVQAKARNKIATLEQMRTEVKMAAAHVESAKQSAIATMQATEAVRYEVYWAKQSGDATRIATAEKKLLAAQENQSIARKTALAAQTDFHTKKKALETAATRAGTTAGVADNVVTDAQIAKKSLLSTVTNGLIIKLKALWATMLANPFTAILSVVGLAISAFTLFKSKQDESNDAMGEFQETTKNEIDYLNVLISVLKNTEAGTKAHKNALEKVNSILQDYNKELLTESSAIEQLKEKYVELTGAINESAAARIKAKYIEKAQQEQSDELEDAKKDLKKGGSRLKKFVVNGNDPNSGGYWERISSIREMHESVYDQIEIMAIESAEKLKNLTGDEYAKGFEQSLQSISNAVKSASNASSEDMEYFNRHLNEYLTSTVESMEETDKKIIDLTKSVEAFTSAGGDNHNITETVDYTTMSFSELDKLVKETQSRIDELNKKSVKVESDNEALDELLQQITTINTSIESKEQDLDTESGINARIKQLREERENVKINSDAYNTLTTKINDLANRLPISRKTENNELKKQEQLAEKQILNDLKLEQARIEVMEEGYEKRKAILEYQHKRNLADIEKEENELIKIRKEAGKGDLTEQEKQEFNERRSLENQNFTKEQNRLFDGEIDYKKRQYELYFRWVKNMGKDVADTHFSNLLKGGSSYKEYIEKQIQELSKKQVSGTITEGESNHLIALNMQYDEITGAKTAMDAFRDSVSQAINRASTLAEKIEAIADAKQRLESGSTGIVVADEQAEANLFLSKEEDEANKELQERILNDFKTFEEKKASIQKEYALLRNSDLALNNDALLAEINRGEAEALSALNAQMLMQTDSWKNLFTDLDALTVDQINKLIEEIQSKMNTADLNLNPADLKAVLDKLDEAKRKVLDVNPFKALGSALKNVFSQTESGSKKSSSDIKREWSDLAKATEGTFDFVNDAIASCDVLGDLIGDNGKATIQMLQGVATSAIAMSSAIKTAEKGSVILAAIAIALQTIQWIATIFNKDAKIDQQIKNIQSRLDDLTYSYERLTRAASKTYWVYNTEEKQAHEQRLTAINDQIAALEKQAVMAQSSWDFVGFAQITKEIKDLRNELEDAERDGDMFQLHEAQKRYLRTQQELLKQQIEAEKQKKAKNIDHSKIDEWEKTMKDIDDKIDELDESLMETLAGTDVKSAIDEFADALVDAYLRGEDAAKSLGEVTKNVMKKAVVEAIKRQYLAKGIEEAVEYLGESMKDGVLSDKERAKFEGMVNQTGEATKQALEAVGDWIKDIDESIEDPLTGGIKAISEETGSLVAGRLNAVVINQSDSLALMRQSLIYQQSTAANTGVSASELKEIKDTLKRIETKDSSLLASGIS